jgi:methylase of polypeptide subunit release factors
MGLDPKPGPADQALVELLRRLDALGYDFVAPTPATHARVVRRPGKEEARTLRDVLGWSLPLRDGLIRADLLVLLERGGALVKEEGGTRCSVRVSRVEGLLFLHGAYPTDRPDSVFLGPDSYRFVRFVKAELAGTGGARRIVDMGAGAGVGGIVAARLLPEASVILVDANREALRLARINAAAAGVAVEIVEGDALDDVAGEIDLVIANPPFIIDEGGPAYRDGGSMLGARLSHDWALAAARRLRPGGRMLLYTGSAIVAGRDGLREALERDLAPLGCGLAYEEIDPDIFGEQLDLPSYRDVERIAAVGAVISRTA